MEAILERLDIQENVYELIKKYDNGEINFFELRNNLIALGLAKELVDRILDFYEA